MLRALPERYAGRYGLSESATRNIRCLLTCGTAGIPGKRNGRSVTCASCSATSLTPGGGIVGPRYERWLSTFAQASIALLGRRASLESIAVISQDRENMQKVSRILMNRYPELAQRIQSEYAEDRSNEFQNTLNWYLSKFQRLTSIEQLRKTLGAGTNALNFGQTVDTDAVTLIDLASRP